MHICSDTPLAVLSSAIVGGELRQTRHIVNMQVPKDYSCGNHVADLNAMAHELGIAEPFVGMLTAARLERAQAVTEQDEHTAVVAVVTVGLSHPVASGVTPAFSTQPGTINTVIIVDGQLNDAARVSAVNTATEAKTLALVEANVRARHGGPASGTGTDAFASTERGRRFEYAGPIAPSRALPDPALTRSVRDGARERRHGKIVG